MANIKVSALTAQSASATTFTYGITNSSTDGKVAVGAADGIPIFNSTSFLLPTANIVGGIGTAALTFPVGYFQQATSIASTSLLGIQFTDGAGTGVGALGYYSGVGMYIRGAAVTQRITMDLSAVTINRIMSWPDIGGSVSVTSDPQFFTSGGAVTPAAFGASINLFVNPVGTVAAMTVTLPNGTMKNQKAYITFTQIITALTVSATLGTSGLPAPTTAAANTTYAYVWSNALAVWNRFL